MKKVIITCLTLCALSSGLIAADPNVPAGPVRHPSSRRPRIDTSPEAVAARRETSKEKAAQFAAERRARREKLAAEYAERKIAPAAKRPTFGSKYFLLVGGGILFVATIIAFVRKPFR